MNTSVRRGPSVRIMRLVAVILVTTSVAFLTNEGQAKASCSGSLTSFWSSGGFDEKMWPINSTYCWLTGLSGNWTGTGQGGGMQGAEVMVERDGFWHLVTYQYEDVGLAMCQTVSCFSGNAGYSVEWDNINFPNNQWNESEISDTCGNGCDKESIQNGYPGLAGTQAALTMLQGWPLEQGATNGGGEYASVSNNPGHPNTITTQSCVENESCWGILQATFGSIFVGVLGTTTPIWPQSWGSASASGNYATSVDILSNSNSAICYFMNVGGAFRTDNGSQFPLAGNEPAATSTWVGVSNGEWWGGVSAGGNGNVQAGWNCMGLHQNH